MSKLDRFKQFIEKDKIEYLRIKKEREDMAREILEEFFSEELKIINDIQDMKVEWEDDGVSITTDITINNRGSKSDDLGRWPSGEEVNIVSSILRTFGPNDGIVELVEYWKDHGHELTIYLYIEKYIELGIDCIEKLSKRIKSAYPQLKISCDEDYHSIEIIFP